MRIGSVAMAVGAAFLAIAPARADFVLGNTELAGPPSAPVHAASSPADLPTEEPGQAAPRFKLARGFGDAVPMSFAVRQIVPAAIRVHYGAGVDPDTPVSWKGDRPWNQALAAAVRPLHLQIVTGMDTVLITR